MGLVDIRIEHIFHRPWKWLSMPKSWDKGREVRSLAFLLFQHMPLAATQSYLLNSTKMRKYQMHWRFSCTLSSSSSLCVPFCPSLCCLFFPSLLSLLLQDIVEDLLCSKNLGFTQMNQIHSVIPRLTVQWGRRKITQYNFTALYEALS